MVASWWEEAETKVASWELLFLEGKSYFLISAIQLRCGVRKPKAKTDRVYKVKYSIRKSPWKLLHPCPSNYLAHLKFCLFCHVVPWIDM